MKPCRTRHSSLVTGHSDLTSGKRSISAFQRFSVSAFTLIELLVVVTIIIILMGILFPVFRGVQDQAKKVQAKNDLTQIVSAINGYYTEYGKYPMADALQGQFDSLFGNPGGFHGNEDITNVLRSINAGANANNVLNPRQIVYLNIANVKDATSPRSGIATQSGTSSNGSAIAVGAFIDPWGNTYMIGIDGNYDGYTQDYIPYSDVNYSTVNGQGHLIQGGCFALTWGKDGKQGTNGNQKYSGSDDVLSWQ